MKKMFLVLLLMLLAGTAVACGAAGDESGEMEVQDVWGRSSPMAAENGAFYMQVTNNTGQDDKLLSAATDACGTVELHEMYMRENDVMGMRPVPDGFITLPAGEMVELRVGGLHVMCLDKQIDFAVGTEIPLLLTFENAGEMEVVAEIRDMADGGMNMDN